MERQVVMVNIFNEIRFIESALLERSINNSDSLLNLRISLFERIKTWVKTAPYSSYKNKRIFIETYFYYSGVENITAIIARKLAIKPASVRLIKKRLSSEAITLLGADITTRLLNGDEAVLSKLNRDLTTLEKGVAVSAELFPIEVIEGIRKTSLYDIEYSLAQCKREIAFLNFFTIENIGRIMCDEEFSTEKMNCLIKILDKPSDPNYKRLIRMVTCENLLEQCRPEDRTEFIFPRIKQD